MWDNNIQSYGQSDRIENFWFKIDDCDYVNAVMYEETMDTHTDNDYEWEEK